MQLRGELIGRKEKIYKPKNIKERKTHSEHGSSLKNILS